MKWKQPSSGESTESHILIFATDDHTLLAKFFFVSFFSLSPSLSLSLYVRGSHSLSLYLSLLFGPRYLTHTSYGALLHPFSAVALANLALFQQCVRKKFREVRCPRAIAELIRVTRASTFSG